MATNQAVLQGGGIMAAALMLSPSVGLGGLVIEDTFDSNAGWRSLLIGPVAGSGGWQATGGNPGGHWDQRVTLPGGQPLGGRGIFTESGVDLSAFDPDGLPGASVRLGIDYRFNPGPLFGEGRMVVALLQDNRAYLPIERLMPGTSESWVTLGEASFDLGGFSHSSGTALDFGQPIFVAVAVLIGAGEGGATQTSFGLDNLRVEFVPAPGAGLALLVGLGIASRRQRSS